MRQSLQSVYAFCNLQSFQKEYEEDGKQTAKKFYAIYGVSMEGKRELLDIIEQRKETLAYWEDELKSLKERGVEKIILFYADDKKNLKRAIKNVFGEKEQHVLEEKDWKDFDMTQPC